MSWSLRIIGEPKNVSRALDEFGAKLTDSGSKDEYGAALPHLKAIVEQNIGNTYNGSPTSIKVEASGGGYIVDGEVKQRSLTVNINLEYINLALDKEEPKG